MASSTLTGDRRWGQTRKSGMTVLGKVPKPINLPSQRLENHGLDPTVEIVPKGTLTWGSRPSLTTSNAWGSTSVSSPKTDGSSDSPSCLSSRPLSGGSCRPSTSASDRSYQATSSAWGSNSRPSSASGILPSNQTSAALGRPRSAETRPGSSQLSSFPEHVAETAAWGPTRTVEKFVTASKPNAFTLSSGDFPTLGSEKNQKLSLVQQDHRTEGRPTSASGRIFGQKETVESTPAGIQNIAQLEKGNVNTWEQDNGPYPGNAALSGGDNWQGDQQQILAYQHANVPPHQFDSWHRAPMQNSPDGIWYRGAHPGGVYRPGSPGGPPVSYPVEPCIYYPHLPGRPLSNSQAAPRLGPVGSGYGTINGVPYRPQAPDSFIVPNQPVRPMRPEVYPRPMHYENYYGPGPNPGNGNGHDGPVLGMAPGSSLSNQHINKSLNMNQENFRAVPCYYASSLTNEQPDLGNAHDFSRPPYKVLLKQHDNSNKCDSEEKNQINTDTVAPLELGDSSLPQVKGSKDDPLIISQHPDAHSRSSQLKVSKDEPGILSQHGKHPDLHSSVSIVHKNVLVSTKTEIDDGHYTTDRKGEDPPRYSMKKNTLIEKIESLNNKARVSDGRSVVPGMVGDQNNKCLKNVNTQVEPTKEAKTGSILPDKAEEVSFMCVTETKDDKEVSNLESVVDTKWQNKASELNTADIGLLGPSDVSLVALSTHKRVHGKQSRVDYHTKQRVNEQDAEEWKKKSPGRNSSSVDSTGNCSESTVQDSQVADGSEKNEFHNLKVADNKYSVSSTDPADYKTQHAKMKEIARQRSKQLQKEEEERIREQKARAQAKLEELNRRTLTETSNHTVELSPKNEVQCGPDARTSPEEKSDYVAGEAQSPCSGSVNAVVQKTNTIDLVGVPAELNRSVSDHESSVKPSLHSLQDASVDNGSSIIQKEGDTRKEVAIDSQLHGNSVTKHKQMSQKRKDNGLEEKHMSENVSIGVMVGSIIVGSHSLGEPAPPSNSCGDAVRNNNKDLDGPSLQHKKRNTRIPKNKNRMDEAATEILPTKKVENVKTEVCKPKALESVCWRDVSVLSEASNNISVAQETSNVATMSGNQSLADGTAGAEVPSKAPVQWRPQPPKRITRNSQSVKSVDKFHGTEGAVWAPVKSINRKELPVDVQKDTDKANTESSGKNGNDLEHNMRSRRAEMERYVPKPIFKEFTHQETSHLEPSSVHQALPVSKAEDGSESTIDRDSNHSATTKMEFSSSTRNGENSRPNKHGKAHASWRRRGPPESSSPLPSLLEGSSSSDSNKDTQKASFLQQSSKCDNSQKEQLEVCDDGWNDDSNYLIHSERMNRSKRQPFKGHKVGGSSGSRDNWETGHGRNDKAVTMSQMMTMESDESAVRRPIRSEGQIAGGHPKSQWQPKSQTSSSPNHREGTVEMEVQRVASQGDRYDKSSLLPSGGNHDQLVEDESVSTAITFRAETRNPRPQEVKRERRVREESFIRQGRPPNQENRILPEPVPQNVISQNQPVSSGAHQGQRGAWLVRNRDNNFDGDSGQGQGADSLKHNQPANRRRQYQRSGYYDRQIDSFKHNSAVGEEAEIAPKSLGKYRERGHNQPRRGSHVYSQNRISDVHGHGD